MTEAQRRYRERGYLAGALSTFLVGLVWLNRILLEQPAYVSADEILALCAVWGAFVFVLSAVWPVTWAIVVFWAIVMAQR